VTKDQTSALQREDAESEAAGSGAPRVTLAHIEAKIARADYYLQGVLTICVLTMRNGFTITGESACASPENFNAEYGRKLAYEQAVGKVWAFEGYLLREELHKRAALLASMAFEPEGDVATFIGTKVVNATRMNRRDYNTYRGWQLPENENGDDEGYLVEYTDRVETPPHVQGRKGYVSWSPKEVFERAYRRA
jgi:hypothetical protein